MNNVNEATESDCQDCKKQRQDAVKCVGPLGYSVKCKKHSSEITEIKQEKKV